MAYKKNSSRRDLVIKACAITEKELSADPFYRGPSVYRRVAECLGISYHMVCYYMRQTKPPTQPKPFSHYDNTTLQFLNRATPKQKQEFAEKRGVTLRAVHMAINRFYKAGLGQADLKHKFVEKLDGVSLHHQRLKNQGFINFSKTVDLQYVHIRQEDFRKARVYLKPFGLKLRAPNVLLHKPTGKHIYLTTQEQVDILTDPALFLVTQAPKLKSLWQDPSSDTFYTATPFKDALWYYEKYQQIKPTHEHYIERNEEGQDLINTLGV